MDIGIEIKYVTKSRDNKTVQLSEVIEVKEIISFREWKKGDKDKDVEGDMTFLLVRPNEWAETLEERTKPRRFLLTEKYTDFMLRMRSNGVAVK